MEKIKRENPFLYNQIIAGFSRVQKQFYGEQFYGGDQDQKIKSAFGQSTANIDAAIAAVNDTPANTTSFSNRMAQSLKALTKPDSKENTAKYEKELQELDGIFKTVYQNKPITQDLERAMALQSIALRDNMAMAMKYGMTQEKYFSLVPNIIQAMNSGLNNRGYRYNNENTPLNNQTDL